MSEKIPKLSIITVCYNNRNGLQKTFQSVIRQTFTDFEYIIIDGGSTDGTVDFIKANEQHIKYWISEKDNGIYNAMNKGIKVAKGEYCYFLNSDDCIAAPNTLEKIFAKIKNNPDIIYGNLAVLKNDKLQYVTKFSKNITPYSFYRHKQAIHHQASFIKRTLFNQYGLYNENIKLISDWAFFFEVILLYDFSTQYINIVFAVFLSGGESSTGICEKHIKNDIMKIHFYDKQIDDYKLKENLYKKLKINKLEKLFGKIFLFYTLLKNEIKNENQ